MLQIDKILQIETEEEPQVPTQRPQRTKRTPDYYGDVVSHRYGVWEENEANIARVDDPKTFREATTCSNSDNWKAAIDAELSSLQRNGTWELVALPPGKRFQVLWKYIYNS